MYIFMTGGTGYIGGYVLDVLMREHEDIEVMLLTRARSREEGLQKLWRGLQMHMDEATFWEFVPRVEFVFGDLTAPDLGIEAEQRQRIVETADSVLHIAASLNRKSAKACLNHNLRGTLSVVKLAREIADTKGLRRFSHVSTVAVAGKRDSEVVFEDRSIEWERSDYDPYARTKKFCEHMIRELLPDVQKTFFRPSIVMGDSRHQYTTQFDMVRAFCVLADFPVLPFGSHLKQDIVNADFVGRAIAELHLKAEPDHQIYHLSSGTAAKNAGQIVEALLAHSGRRPPVFLPSLGGSFSSLVDRLAGMKRRNTLMMVGSLFKVFLPYITFNTVFDNTRVTKELGVDPVSFTDYCTDLYEFAKGANYRYPYVPLERPIEDADARQAG